MGETTGEGVTAGGSELFPDGTSELLLAIEDNETFDDEVSVAG